MKRNISFKMALTLLLIVPALIFILLLSACDELDFSYFFPENGNRGNDRVNEFSQEYANLLRMIDELFIGDFDMEHIHTEAMRALVFALEDEWSFYLTEEEFARFTQRARNRYSGIGVEILINDEVGGMEVVRVYRGSPAETGGILPGDIITFIDGQAIAGFNIHEVRELLARPLGDYAQITVRRSDKDVVLTIMYAEVFIDPIEFEMLDGYIGYIAISNFDANSGERFIYAVNELIEKGATSFIYDVRSNPGGRLNEMTRILNFLLPEGEIFFQENRQGEEHIIMSDEYWLDMPAVVLVNRFSYSAAEFFAAMLSEYEYALTVGEQTTGKNRTQSTHRIRNTGNAVNLSTTHYLTRNRVNLREVGGFVPDFIVELSDEDIMALMSGRLDRRDDTQLQFAISLLRDKN